MGLWATENFSDLKGKAANAVAAAIKANVEKDPNLKAFKDNLAGDCLNNAENVNAKEIKGK